MKPDREGRILIIRPPDPIFGPMMAPDFLVQGLA